MCYHIIITVIVIVIIIIIITVNIIYINTIITVIVILIIIISIIIKYYLPYMLSHFTTFFGSSQRGGLVKGGLAIYAHPLCNCNTLGFVFNVEIEEHMPNC